MVDARWRMVPGPSLMIIDLFYRYGGHIEFIRFKEYYGMHRGHSLSIYARFSAKKRTSLYISREKGDHYHIQTRYNDLFFPLQSFSRKTLRKIGPKSARIYTERVYLIVPMPPGYPIVLPKSNTFNIVAVSVKRSIDVIRTSLILLQIFMG